MSKVNQLNDHYRKVLGSMSIFADADGLLSLLVNDINVGESNTVPCTIALAGEKEQRRLVMPTQERLSSGKWDGVVAFHPLSENMLRGESDVIKLMRKMVLFRVQMVTAELMMQLMTIAANPETHAELSPRAAEFLTLVPEADASTLKGISKLLDHHLDKFVSIYLKRNGVHKGVEYRRLGVVSFPIWEELNTKGSKVYDQEMGSARNKKTIAALFAYIFPNPEDTDAWTFGVNADVAPYYVALLTAYHHLIQVLNARSWVHRKHLQGVDVLRIDDEFFKEMDQLPLWKDAIPPLEGNRGATAKGEKEQQPAQVSVQAPQHSYAQQAMQAAAVVGSGDGGQSVQPTPAYHQPAPAVTVGQPVQPAPAYHQPAPQPQPAAGGVDWRSIRLARQTQTPGMVGYQQPQQPVYPPQQPVYGQQPIYPPQPAYGQQAYPQPPVYGQQPMYPGTL